MKNQECVLNTECYKDYDLLDYLVRNYKMLKSSKYHFHFGKKENGKIIKVPKKQIEFTQKEIKAMLEEDSGNDNEQKDLFHFLDFVSAKASNNINPIKNKK